MKGYDLTLAAEEDLRGIWRYTLNAWGIDQAEKYFDQIEMCCEAIASGDAPERTHVELPAGVRVHRCEHHYIFWLHGDPPTIIAILHERMNFVRHLKARL